MTAGTIEQVVLDPAILDANTVCELAETEPYRECEQVAEYVGTMPCGRQLLACADHMARIVTGWTEAVGCVRACESALPTRSGRKAHWMVDVTWRRA